MSSARPAVRVAAARQHWPHSRPRWRSAPTPAALTATVGVKPTYGTVSRYGLAACASSLDQGGPCARTVLDTALLHAIIAGHDPRDSTSVDAPIPDVVAAAKAGATGDLSGVR